MSYTRKSHYIETINHKDVDFLNALRCGGICTKEQATQIISGNRLRNFVLDKTIEKYVHVSKSGEQQEVYRITEQGKHWIREHIESLSDRKFYSSTGVQHDLTLMEKILSLTQAERETMRCESEVRDDFRERMELSRSLGDYERYHAMRDGLESGTASTPDLAYGIDTYFEVITSSYGLAEIEAKTESVALLGGQLEMERT